MHRPDGQTKYLGFLYNISFNNNKQLCRAILNLTFLWNIDNFLLERNTNTLR